MKFYLVKAMLNTRFGIRGAEHRILAASDPINAARACFDDLPDSEKRNGIRYPDHFRVYAQVDPQEFTCDVGVLTVENEFDEDSHPALEQVRDMFTMKGLEVRL